MYALEEELRTFRCNLPFLSIEISADKKRIFTINVTWISIVFFFIYCSPAKVDVFIDGTSLY
jgi:hypothetical protein